ncbi:MAG TPA: hypothetical protein VG407_02450 [Caulobacteraceae bacterium]|jgi:hypothetical protein|nr:hypothetical protein [Caulobacteraceae bacterium]
MASIAKAPGWNRPETFLFPPWRGSGVTCDAFGIQRDKYEVSGGGRIDEDGSAVIDYVVAFASGLTNTHAWKIKPDTGDQIFARDLMSGEDARGRITPIGFYWITRAPIRTAFGTRLCKVEVSYEILSASEAISTVTAALLGVTVATASAHLRYLDAGQQDQRKTG